MKKKVLFLFTLLLTLTCFGIVFASNSAGNGARNAIGATGNTAGNVVNDVGQGVGGV